MTLLDLFSSCLIANPEVLLDCLKRVDTHDRDKDANVSHGILSDPERTTSFMIGIKYIILCLNLIQLR